MEKSAFDLAAIQHFDRGNYCSAYEVADDLVGGWSLSSKLEHIASAQAAADPTQRVMLVASFIDGYYSSYEPSEVPLHDMELYTAMRMVLYSYLKTGRAIKWATTVLTTLLEDYK